MEVNRLAELQRKRKAAASTNNFKRDTADSEVELPHVDSPVRRKRGGSDEKDRDAEDTGRPERKERGDKKDKPSSNLAAAMKPYEEIKEGLQAIRKNVQSIDSLKEQDKTVVSEKQRKDIMTQLDKIMSETQRIASSIKSTLDQIKTENDAFNAKPENKGSATAQMRTNMYMTHVRRFHQEMNAFNQASHDFKNALKDRTRRQLVIIDKNLTQDEVETIVESGHAEEVIKGMITADLDNVVRDIEERHQGIMRLEKQVLEIYELFRDLATLIDLQQETLDVIEHRISNAKEYTGKGMEALKSGEKYQKKANKRQRIILACVLCIMVALVLLLSLGLGAKFF